MYNFKSVNEKKTELIHNYKKSEAMLYKTSDETRYLYLLVQLIETNVTYRKYFKVFELFPTSIIPYKFLSLPKYSNVAIL